MVNKQEKVTAIFSALADPTRRRIMERLYGRGETRATAVAVPFRISIPAISRHRVLENARLIERRRMGRLHLIRAGRAGLEEARRWMTPNRNCRSERLAPLLQRLPLLQSDPGILRCRNSTVRKSYVHTISVRLLTQCRFVSRITGLQCVCRLFHLLATAGSA